MRIRSVTLHGFKSFGNRTTLELSPRISVIAGPNGSGKSNVVDALRWATGGGRASEFRAGEKTELIFHGASGKRSLGYAEVEVELEGDGLITVQRTLQRDGSGKLRLNGRNARFLDIDEALSGSGLGKGSLAIIGQGEVSSVLMADPARLLSFVAEAAGVARLSGRRELAEDRLSRARDHMDRLNDLVEEQERQLERLEAEAASAARQADLSREALALQFTISVLRRQALESELQGLAGQEAELVRTVQALQEDQRTLGSDLRVRREALAAQQESFRKATAQLEAWKGEVRLAEGRETSARERLTDLRRQAGMLDAEFAALANAEPPSAPEGNEEQLQARVSKLGAAETALRSESGGLDEAARSSRAELDRLLSQAAEQERAVALHGQRALGLTDQLEATRKRLQGKEFDHAEAESAGSTALEAELTGLQQQLELSRDQLAARQEKHALALAEARSLEVSVQRLQAAIEARSGFAQGPRVALASGLPGVIGAVADLLELDEEHRLAIAAALGGRSEFVVVETAEQGQAVIGRVRSKGAYVTVLPLDLLRPGNQHVPPAILEAPGVIGPALNTINYDRRYSTLFSQLLGNTVITRDMPAAVALARSHRDRPRLVTLDGEILDRGGAMSGGRRQSNAGVLGQARELEALQHDSGIASAAVAAAHEDLLALQQQVRSLQEQVRTKQQQLEAARQREARLEQERAVRSHLRQDLEQRLAQLEQQLAELEAQPLPLPLPEGALAAARSAAEQASARLQEHAARLAAATEASSEAVRELAVWRERHNAWLAARQRHDTDQTRLRQLEQRRAELMREAEAQEQLLQSVSEAAASLAAKPPVELSAVESAYQEARLQLARAEERLEETGRELAGHQEQLERLRVTLARRETMLQAAAEEAERFPPGLEAMEGSERNLRSRLVEVNRELEQLGPVNHRAAAELEQERLRARQLASDVLDAEEAARELQNSLELVDQEVSSRSEAAIAAVRSAFAEHVAELFGPDAEAGIEVIREDGRPSGLTMKLQPPGKRTTQLNLLSVGERTMGAMAFLFSLMDGSGSQGLPIAVLDEVDAPLDEANIRRFASFVERTAEKGTQFLLISHQKTTFAVADSMWGVTSDKGVSTVFSISRDA